MIMIIVKIWWILWYDYGYGGSCGMIMIIVKIWWILWYDYGYSEDMVDPVV